MFIRATLLIISQISFSHWETRLYLTLATCSFVSRDASAGKSCASDHFTTIAIMQAGVGMTLINFYRNNGQEKSKRWQKPKKKIKPFQNEKDTECRCTEFIRGLPIHFITHLVLVAIVNRILLFSIYQISG